MTSYWVNAGIRAALDSLVDRVDVSAPGKIRIYSGTPPADADASLSGNTLLAELAMSNPAFGAAADSSPGATATASAISNDASADATGTATFFRILDGANAVVAQGSVTATGGGGNMELNTVSIVAAAIVSISAGTAFMAESAA
jgi:hypothetical protein